MAEARGMRQQDDARNAQRNQQREDNQGGGGTGFGFGRSDVMRKDLKDAP